MVSDISAPSRQENIMMILGSKCGAYGRSSACSLTHISITMPCSAFRQRINSLQVRYVILAGPQTGSGAMGLVVIEHITATSPYSKFQTQPTPPPGLDVKGAVYLYRHGIIHVNGHGHDFDIRIISFLDKLKRLEKSGKENTRRELAFLQDYSCRIQERDISRISEKGMRQCHKMGKILSKRYADTLLESNSLKRSRHMDGLGSEVSGVCSSIRTGIRRSQTGEDLVANHN